MSTTQISTTSSENVTNITTAATTVGSTITDVTEPTSTYSAHHSKPTVILFIFASCALGAIIRTLLKKVPLPYTVLLLIIGALFGLLALYVPDVQEYCTIANTNPHVILHVFLPVLIFESAFAMEAHTFLKSFFQIVTLAIPGLLVASVLTAVFALYVFNYNWNWNVGLMFGAILSATDPVAVVALLKELGASKQLACMIEGESLLNDGAAIVLFKIFLEMSLPNTVITAGSIALTFFQVAIGGPAFGFLIAKITTFWLSKIFNDALTEITITLAATYLTYYIGEDVLHVSGVLGVVVVGVVLSAEKTSISPEVEAFLHRFWEMLAYLANTLIFIIVGVVITWRASTGMGGRDWILMIALYFAVNIIRGITIALFSPLLKRIGYGLTWRNGAIMTWGGLRGAVGLALALLVAQESRFSDAQRMEIGHKILFHTAGIVILTLVINATTVSKLLSILGMSDVSAPKRMAMASAVRTLKDWREKSSDMLKTDRFLADADWEVVETLTTVNDPYNTLDEEAELNTLSYLERSSQCPRCSTLVQNVPTPAELHEMKNEARLRMLKAQKTSYWRQFEHGMLSREAVRKLVESAEIASDKEGEFIDVWEIKKSWEVRGIYSYLKKRLQRWIRGRGSHVKEQQPTHPCAIVFYDIANHTAFEYSMYAIIFGNIIPIIWEIALDNIDKDWVLGFRITNYIFMFFYLAEMIIKLVAFKLAYFKDYWNVFDFIIIVLSLADIVLDLTIFEELNYSGFNPNILKIARVVKMVRLLRGLRLFRALVPQVISFLNGRINRQLRFGYDIGKGYVVGEEEVRKSIGFMADKKIGREMKTVVENGRLEVIRALGLLQREHPGIAVSIKTQQAARRILNNLRDKIVELRGEGLLDEEEAQKLEVMVETNMKRLQTVPTSLPPPPPESIIGNIPWMNKDENLITFFKDRARLELRDHGSAIVLQGEEQGGIYIIVSGLVKIEAHVLDNTPLEEGLDVDAGKAVSLASAMASDEVYTDYLTAGNVIGEVDLLTGVTRKALITCETATQLYHLTSEDMKLAIQLFSHEPSLEYRLWRVCAIRLATRILMNQAGYQNWSQEKVKLHLQNGYLPDLKSQRYFKVDTTTMKDVVLINGTLLEASTRNEFHGPCYIPRTVDKLITPKSSDTISVLLVIPRGDAVPVGTSVSVLSVAIPPSEQPADAGNLCLRHASQHRAVLEARISDHRLAVQKSRASFSRLALSSSKHNAAVRSSTVVVGRPSYGMETTSAEVPPYTSPTEVVQHVTDLQESGQPNHPDPETLSPSQNDAVKRNSLPPIPRSAQPLTVNRKLTPVEDPSQPDIHI